MQQVQDEKIKNETVRKLFFNIPSTKEYIAIRQSSFLGKILRHPKPTHLPKQLLPAWVNNKRPVGPPITTNKKSFLKSITMLYSANSKTDPFKGAACPIDKKGSFELWLEDALDEKKWELLISAQLRTPHLKVNPPQEQNQRSNAQNEDTNDSPPSPPPQRNSTSRPNPPSPPTNCSNNFNPEGVGSN